MAIFKVSFEINLEAKDPISAAKTVQEWMQNTAEDGINWQYYVQNEKTRDIFSVDLGEDVDDIMYVVDNYQSFIKPRE